MKKLRCSEYKKPYIPLGMWSKCNNCKKISYYEDLNKNNYICPICNVNMVMPIENRLRMLFDENTLREIYFNDEFDEKYIELHKDKYVYTGIGEINKIKVGIIIINDCFSNIKILDLVSKKICALVEELIKNIMHLIAVVNDTKKERDNIFSVKYLAMICSEISKLDNEGLLFISILSKADCFGEIDKFVMNADIVLCEINRNENDDILNNGFIDCVISRDELKRSIYNILKLHYE